MTTTTPAAQYVTLIGTIGAAPKHATTKGGAAVANSALYDNRAAGGRKLYTLTAYGSAIDKLAGFAVGDLVLVRARVFDKHWQRDGKAGVEHVAVMTSVAKVLRRKGEGKPAARQAA